jgi:hypothetical protein
LRICVMPSRRHNLCRNLYLAAAGLVAIAASTAANAVPATCSSLGLTFGDSTPGPTLTAPESCTFSETLTGTGLAAAQAFFDVSGPSSLTVSGLTYSGSLDGAALFSPNDSKLSNLLADASKLFGTNSFTYSTLTSSTVYDLVVAGASGDTIAGTFNLTAVPLPASAWLLLGALGGMGLLTRRRSGSVASG